VHEANHLADYGAPPAVEVRAIPLIALAMNKQPHSALPKCMSPYKVMFGQKPR
jgi:hypothetical protein